MKLTLKKLESLNSCNDGLAWYKEHGSEDLLETLLAVNKHRPDWARWLYTRLMSLEQNQHLSIYASEQVLHIFEFKYPLDKRSRNAIEAAKLYLMNKISLSELQEARKAAYAAADAAAADAASAAYAAYASASAYAAAYAAYSSSDMREMQERIINEAVRILEGEE